MLAIPHLGQRDVFIDESGRRTSIDFAHCLDYLANTLHPGAEKIVLVMDNLNTDKEASLYKAFSPQKARALCERFEFHYTPTHGSWLNMAEIEIGLLVRAHGYPKLIENVSRNFLFCLALGGFQNPIYRGFSQSHFNSGRLKKLSLKAFKPLIFRAGVRKFLWPNMIVT